MEGEGEKKGRRFTTMQLLYIYIVYILLPATAGWVPGLSPR